MALHQLKQHWQLGFQAGLSGKSDFIPPEDTDMPSYQIGLRDGLSFRKFLELPIDTNVMNPSLKTTS